MPSDYVIALNATVYYADIHIGHPLNTPVFRIRAFFKSTANLLDAHITLSQTGQVNKLFEFEGGSNDRIEIEAGDIGSMGSYGVYSTSINIIHSPETEFRESDYPVRLMMVITFNVLYPQNNVSHFISHGTGSIQGQKIIILHLFLKQFDFTDPCGNMPCGNGSCTPGIGSQYSCDCFAGFTGTNCEVNINDCPGNECVNGTCVDGVGNYTCDCEPGFNGTFCDQEINECDNVDCNNGTCTDLVNDYMCECYQYYTGQYCDTFLSCGASPCQNEGTCIDVDIGTFSCLCPPEWTGMTCGEDALPCDPNPCSNGGNCSNNGNKFLCACAMGWTGNTCADKELCSVEANSKEGLLLAVIFGLIAIILFLCGLSVLGFMLACKNHCKRRHSEEPNLSGECMSLLL